jgi:hypothetical protein
MMPRRTLVAVALLFALIPVRIAPSPAGPLRAQVMIVGVAHFVARRDVHNSTFTDSPLSPKRQAQIADVVARLARFHPTKVLVEVAMGDLVIRQRYRRFRNGAYTLPPNEVYQFGFRLAKAAGDRDIYPIDTFGPTLLNDNKRIDAYLASHFSNIHSARFDAYLAHENAIEARGTYLDLLRYLNSDGAIDANASSYSVLDGIGRDADDAGSAYVSQWYARNCYIFSNILSVIAPGDRIVIIMGQGHEYLLREFTRLNPNLYYVPATNFLR